MKSNRKSLNIAVCYILVIALFLIGTVLGSRTVTVISENLPVEREHTIIIDAGHGGEDGGTTSCTGKLESGYNLEIALRLEDLCHLLGYDTVMIRRTDISVYTKGETIAQKKISDLKERVRIANSTENAVLISVHQNFYPESQYSGAQVFYGNSDGSEDLAKLLQNQLISSLNPGSRRRVKKGSGIYLLDKMTCPGVLIECGFLSNPEEESLLSCPDYQKKLVCVIASSVGSWIADA